MVCVSVHRTEAAGRLWRIGVLSAAAAVGTASQAEAAIYYWSDSDSGYSRAAPAVPQRRQKSHHQAKKLGTHEKEQTKPQGPVIVSISINRQNLKIYDANGFFAEAPVSTGMKGHPTPMGVFSVIQKQKLHHSNIYSGAPMPYMQRITWSGIAIHAGVLPGYPASHGCIRMPMAFAMKMWNWTKMGARVFVTPGEMTPENFSHPLLVTQKVAPQPNPPVEPQADAPAAAKSDKASDAGATSKTTIAEANLGLRPTVGHDAVKPTLDQSASASLREQIHTADAAGATVKASVTMTDATSSGDNSPPAAKAAATADSAPHVSERAASVKASDTSEAKPESAHSEDAKSDVVKSEAEPAAAKPGETVSADDKTAESKGTNTVTAESKPADQAAATTRNDASAEISTTGSMKPEQSASGKKLEAKVDDIKADTAKPDVAKTSEAPADSVAVEPGPEPANSTVTAKKDQGRLAEPAKPAASKPDVTAAPKRTGPIAVFISRKDSKLYVRQNFAPLYDAPVTIAASDRPLGTHVFTADVDKNHPHIVHWSVVSLPVAVRYAERHDEEERGSRRHKGAHAAVVEAKPSLVPDSPAEALDRIAIPPDVMARITDALSTGTSIVVSDQGINQGETGEGTDFIVSLR